MSIIYLFSYVVGWVGIIGLFLSRSEEKKKKFTGIWVILFSQIYFLFIGIFLISGYPPAICAIVSWFPMNGFAIVWCYRELRKLYQMRKRARSGKKTVV
ncbi:hypothetical protein [Alkalihalobacillus sp. TS-13]|uniref:hypothetical protein n=1 Tax=Alkalihalobacillus sp. TS-13 TaxID=2842455 RepID=UPI001C878CD5|nr:hypothetical protein [Alkalihalobacillus sp. TS-13]